MFGEYAAALERAPLSDETRRTYRSRVRMFLSWLADHAASHSADPLADRQARDWAVRDYRMWLLRDGPARRSRVYVNSALTALDDFHVRRGLGKADVAREDLPKNAPRALEERARIRCLRPHQRGRAPRCRRHPDVGPQWPAAPVRQGRTADRPWHTLATTLFRGRTDLVLVTEILGHARLKTTRRYSLPSDKGKEDALKLITVDR
ncbi:hypothetical protein [Nonomuraea sp. NPDC001023]|uniref:hypothetical protein n=1 Tax=unclassified Nonomuraea TaxID=2593643 RepID=UPI003316B77E